MEFSIRRPAPLAGASRLLILCMLAAAALAGCGGGGGASTDVTTSGNVPPQITAQPQDATVASGATATFSVTVTGSTPMTYQWMKNSANISGATAASYTTPATTTADNGSSFTVSATNAAGTITSDAAMLSVSGAAMQPQTITFDNPGAQAVGTPLTLVASATSGLTVSFASKTKSVCTVSFTTVTFVAAGTCTIQATQPGNAFFAAATPVTQSFTVTGTSGPTSQTITFANPGAQTVGTPLTLIATASSGLTVSFASQTASVCTVSGTVATFVAAGTCTIQATQPGNGTYAAATPVTQSFTVNSASKIAATPTFSVPAGAYTSAQSVTLSCSTASSTIYYTTNGTTPTTSSSVYSSAISVSSTETIEALCAATGYTNSAVAVAAYTINTSGSLFMPAAMNVSANWQNAGMQSVGGIPSRTTICATVNPLGGGQDDYTNIQNAIDGCPAGQIVQLGAGAFSVSLADLPIKVNKGITLRGTGNCGGSSSPYCQTSISVSNGALAYTAGLCGTSTASKGACPNGGPALIVMAPVSPDFNYSWAQCGNYGGAVGTGCGATALATDAVQGQTTIQVASTAHFSVGQWVLIDEASGAGWVADPLNQWSGFGSVWAASDWLSASPSPATGRVMWAKSQNGDGWDFGTSYPYQANSVGCWFSYCDRPTAELHKVTAVGAGPCPGASCTLTFDDPLTVAFRQSGNHNAQVYGPLYSNQSGTGTPISMLQNASVENLSLLRAASGGMEMELCAYCWIKNVEVGDWYGGGISIRYSVRSELNTVYVHHCWDSVNNGGEYPIAIDAASTEILVTNSITNFAGKGMVARAGGAGSVVSYSYIDDTMYDSTSGIGDYWVDMGINASHYSGPHHVLFEGNWGDNLDSDHTHGASSYMTFFRNQGAGLRSPFTDPSNNRAVNDSTGVASACGTSGPAGCSANAPAPLRAAGPSAYSYWFAFVGNVLGTAGVTTTANGWSYQGDWNAHRIFMLGWNDGPGGQDPYLNGVKGSYIFRSGNYDYVNGSIVDWASGYSQALPNSLYLTTPPSFFSAGATCTYAWPWVTPNGSTQIQANSCGGSGLPALARWKAGTPFVQP